MRNLKKILALALALVMTLSLVTVANAFTDSKDINGTYTEAVDVLSGMGVFQGYKDGSFQPKGDITRAEVAAIIYRIVTGDVTDKQVGIYADYAKFDDVAAKDWFAGYVGYCANAEYIKGYGDGNFGPNDKVTGYQALAMILRAMGYDQNGEFTGEGWEIRVATTAQQRSILVNINQGTLGTSASREVVAEILFQAIQKDTVVYTPALGYYTADLLSGVATTSLGYKTFGLIDETGVVVGNQSTGEKTTKIDLTGTYVGTATQFNTTTGLDLFGHAVKVWYNAKNTGAKTVYAIYDKATLATIVEGNTWGDADAAGFDVSSSVSATAKINAAEAYSDAYSALSTKVLSKNVYPLYALISNNSKLTVDVVIGIDAYVEQVTDINNYVAKPTITFSSTPSTEQSKVVEGLDDVVAGSAVIVNTIKGTTGGSYLALEVVSDTITGKITKIATDGTVTLSGGTKIEQSPLWNFSDFADTLAAGETYVFLLDNNGEYVGIWTTADDVLYVTYAYWTLTGTSTVNYYLQGVTLAGEETVVKTTKAGYEAAVTAEVNYLAAAGSSEGKGSVVETGNYALMTITKTGATEVNNYPYTLEEETLTANSTKLEDNIFLRTSTAYHVIEGFGDDLEITTYTGVKNLVGDATSVTVSGIYDVASLSTSTVTAYNYQVTNVLINSNDATYAGNYLYGGNSKLVAIEETYNENISAYELYIAGEDETTEIYVNTGDGATPAKNTFYKWTREYDSVLEDYVYTLESVNGNNKPGFKNKAVSQAKDTAESYIEAGGVQYATDEDIVIIDLVNGKINSLADLVTAVENNNVTIDFLVNNSNKITVVYVTDVAQKPVETAG